MEYQPLDASRREIRVVTIENEPCGGASVSNGDELIKCHLTTIPLNDDPTTCAFTALSYVWGDATITQPILLGGFKFQVTTNLSGALQFTSKKTGEGLFWIDALCINQMDLAERGSQVRMMGEIYSRAKLVIAWVADSLPGAQEALDCFLWIARQPEEVVRTETAARLTSDDAGPSFRKTLSLLCSFIAHHEYWHRVWVQQEVALAREVKFVWGQEIGRELSISDLSHFANRVRDLALPPNYDDNAETGILLEDRVFKEIYTFATDRYGDVLAYRARRAELERQQFSATILESILGWTRRNHATDARDMISGISGLWGTSA
ncbi:heterokaryon incompatibility protein-domain-containing protein [Diplogelasinospora grovesii]|uniref:Heterokaryon incompatibility protein-domain-containing protein n=1 Tax=Diplogelasinospora grovesii TaxID=303347 RepID=A0AAN6RZ05_9PEZI|nr:heterokaryon incompatibility protein-domain-containing protein [Diplogelasinospora grovesii]